MAWSNFVAILWMYLRSVFYGLFDALMGDIAGKLKCARGQLNPSPSAAAVKPPSSTPLLALPYPVLG